MHLAYFYRAFISYSHEDYKHAAWLHKALEAYSIPKHLQNDGQSKNLTPIFRDITELPANADLTETIKSALAQSEFLIVVCSPAAVASHWVGSEIIEFKRLHAEAKILSIIVDGLPLSADPGRECFPAALRSSLGPDGKLSDIKCEPIAADLRPDGDGKRLAKLKLVAGLLNVGLDQIVQRDSKRRHRAMTIVTASAITAMLVMGYLTWSAIDSRRQAEARRAESEDLVAFMLGDLRQKLEPVGRLDVLSAVGGKVLAHYAKEPANSLSNDSLQQQARALTLLGDIEQQSGDNNTGLATFERASVMTGELMRRQPRNQQYIFDHAQNQFWLGQIMTDSGNNKAAMRHQLDYESLANKLLSLAPNNPKWQLEVAYTKLNIGSLMLEENQPQAALVKFDQEQAMLDAIPKNATTRTVLIEKANALIWKSEAQSRLLRLQAATDTRQSQIAIYQQLLNDDTQDQQVNSLLQAAKVNQAMGLAKLGHMAEATALFENAITAYDQLVRHDLTNQYWQRRKVGSQLACAEVLLENNSRTAARNILADTLSTVKFMTKNTKSDDFWLTSIKAKQAYLSAMVAFLNKDYRSAAAVWDAGLSQHSQKYRAQKADDMLERDRGRYLYLRGEIGHAMGDHNLAKYYWQQAFGQLKPYEHTGEPGDRDVLARAKWRLGDAQTAHQIKFELDKNNYKYPAYLRFWQYAPVTLKSTQNTLAKKEIPSD